MPTDLEGDSQDQSEVFDEDNQDIEGSGEVRTFQDLPDVLDVTTAIGDSDDDAALIAEDLDDDEIIELEADAQMADFEEDELAGRMPEELDDDSIDIMDAEEVYLSEEAGLDIRDEVDEVESDDASELSVSRTSPDEVELVNAGDLDGASVRDGKHTAAMEARSLDDDDLEDLGYARKDDTPQVRE